MRWKTGLSVVIAGVISIFLLSIPISAADSEFNASGDSGYVLRSSVFGGGGKTIRSALYRDCGTVAPITPVGAMSSSIYVARTGFTGGLIRGVSGVDSPGLPHFVTRLRRNYPNPFNPSTTIAFDIASSGRVRISIFDMRGMLVRRLVDEDMPAGRHEIVWNGATDGGAHVASGVFFCRLESGPDVDVRKMLLLK
jgi:hypothetical protein